MLKMVDPVLGKNVYGSTWCRIEFTMYMYMLAIYCYYYYYY